MVLLAFDPIEHINDALDSWYDSLQKVIDVVTQDPLSTSRVGALIQNLVNNITVPVGEALLVLCFFIGLFGAASSMVEAKRPEVIFKLFVRTGVTATLVTQGYTFMRKVLDICQSLIIDIDNGTTISTISAAHVPQEIVSAVADLGFLEKMGVWIISLLGSLAIIVASFIVLLTVYGRFFRIYLYMIVSPIPLATFGANSTSHISIAFLKSFIGAGMEGVVILLSVWIYQHYMIDVLSSPVIDTTASASSMVWGYLTTTIFNILILITIIRTSGTLVREMFGG